MLASPPRGSACGHTRGARGARLLPGPELLSSAGAKAVLFRGVQQSQLRQPEPAQASKDTRAFRACGQRHWNQQGFRHRAVSRELCRLCAMFSTWYVRTSKDFSSAAAKAGGEEISPRYQFDTWPRHKPFLNKILIETAQKGTAVLQNLKHRRIRINFK